MPTPAEQLSITASTDQRQKAVSDCISQLVGEGRTLDQARAICIRQADRSMGTQQARGEARQRGAE